jgi:acyl carrier protein
MTFIPPSRPAPNALITDEAIRDVVLHAMRTLNLARDASSQLTISPQAPIFGNGSALDSLGLLTLLLDIEEDLQHVGCKIRLSDDRAMSQTRSPFGSVGSLVEYIGRVARE